MKISLYDRPPVINTEGAYDDSDILQDFTQRAMEFNRDWSFTDPLREGTANLVRGFSPSNMEIERLRGLVGLDDEAFRARNQDRLLGLLPQNVRDDYLRGEIESLTGWRERVGQIADAIAPTHHREPDSLLGKAGYTALEMLPHIAAAVPIIHALGPMGYAGVSTFTGNQSTQENVYDALRSQGLSPDEAREQATAFLPNAADALIRGGVNFGTMGLLNKAPMVAGAHSPYSQILRNIAMASGVSGAGAMGEQAFTNYRTNTENDIAELAKTGLTAAGFSGVVGLANAARNWRNLRELQRQYWENMKPVAIDWPPSGGDGSGGVSTKNPNDPNPNGGGNAPQIEVLTPEQVARLQKQGEVLAKYKLPQETDLWKGIQDGSIPDDTAVNILVDMGAKPDIARSLVTGSKTLADIERGANNLSRGVPKSAQETPRQPQTFEFSPDWQDPLFPKSRPVKTMDRPATPEIVTPSETPQTNTPTIGTPPAVLWTDPLRSGNVPAQQPATPGLPQTPLIPQFLPSGNEQAYYDDDYYSDNTGNIPHDNSNPWQDIPDSLLPDTQQEERRLTPYSDKRFYDGTLSVRDDNGNFSEVNIVLNNGQHSFYFYSNGYLGSYNYKNNKLTASEGADSEARLRSAFQAFREHFDDFYIPPQSEDTPQAPQDTLTTTGKSSDELRNIAQTETQKQEQFISIGDITNAFLRNEQNIPDRLHDIGAYDKRHDEYNEAVRKAILHNEELFRSVDSPEKLTAMLREVNNDTGITLPSGNIPQLNRPKEQQIASLVLSRFPDYQPAKDALRIPVLQPVALYYSGNKNPLSGNQGWTAEVASSDRKNFKERFDSNIHALEKLSDEADIVQALHTLEDKDIYAMAKELGLRIDKKNPARSFARQFLKRNSKSETPTPKPAPATADTEYPFNIEDSYQGMPKQELKAAAEKNNSLISSIKDKDTLRKRISGLHVPMLRAMSGISGSGYKKNDFINEIVRVATRPIPDGAKLKAGNFSVPGVNGTWTVKPNGAGNSFTISNDDISHSAMVYDRYKNYFMSLSSLDSDTTGAVQKYFREHIKDFYEEGGNTTQEDTTSQPEPVKKAKPALSPIYNYTSGKARSAAENNLQMLRNADEKERIRLLGTLDKGQLMNFAQTMKYHGLGDIGGVANGITRLKQNFLRFLNNPVQDSKPATPQAETTEPQNLVAKPEKSQNDNEPKIQYGFLPHTWVVSLKGEKYFVSPYGASNMEQFREWIINPDSFQRWNEKMIYDAYSDVAAFTEFPDDDTKKSSNTPAVVEAIKKTLRNLFREKNGHISGMQSKSEPGNNSSVRVVSLNNKTAIEKQPEQQPQKSSEPETQSSGKRIIPEGATYTREQKHLTVKGLTWRDHDYGDVDFSVHWNFDYQGEGGQKQEYIYIKPTQKTYIPEKGGISIPRFFYMIDNDSFWPDNNNYGSNDDNAVHAIEKAFREHLQEFYELPKEQSTEKHSEPENASNDSSMPDTPITRLANRVKSRIIDALDEDKDINPFSNDELLKWAAEEFGGTKGQGAFDPREAYDAMEMGINLAIAEAGITPGIAEDTYDVVNDIQRLLRILQTIPTQTNRTKEQVAFQQFSTPPTLAYLVNWLAAIGGDSMTLEPSAGTGNLAVFAQNVGSGLILNDYSKSGLRADILDALGWGEVYRKDALDIADILLPQLDDDERPDRVIMNPPFSAAGKQGTANSNQNGFQHVEQALLLLKDNGRLVAILGAGRDGTASSVKTWLKHIGKTYNVRALITVGGKAYQRYGTTFDNAVVVIDKTGATPKGGTVEYKFSGDFSNDEELYKLFNYFTDLVNDYKDRDAGDNYYFRQSEYEPPEEPIDEETDDDDEDLPDGIYDDEIGEYVSATLENWTRIARRKIAQHPELREYSERIRNEENTHEPQKPAPASKNNASKAEAKNETTAPKQSDIPDTIKNNAALRAIHKYLKGNTDLTLKVDEAIRASMEMGFREDEQKRRQIKRTVYNTLLDSGILKDYAVNQTEEIFDIISREVGYDSKGLEIAKGVNSAGIPNALKEVEKILAKLNDASYDELKDTAESLGVDIHSIVGTRDDSEGNRAKLRTAIKKALKADTAHETQGNNPVQEQENPEPVTDIKPQKYVSRKKSEQPDDNDSSEDESPSIYSDYEPQEHSGIHLFDIAKQHPSQLVETTNMKAVHLPPLTYSPHLPDKMIQSGAISESQLEAVAYAGQAFTQKLPSGQTKGFILGDGTGSGKGRTIAAIITDQLNQNHGNGKAVWFSVSADLFKDAQRDLDGIGEDKKQLFELGETKLGDTIPTAKKGIMFTTYNTLIRTGKKKNDDNNTDNDSESDKSAEGAIDTKRIKQIVDWLGEDFDGVIAFDECHKINNLGGENSGFGISAPSQSADAARKLADALPHARILYVSATSATDPNNLRMFDRTGLWGENTPFANADTFAAEIKAGGPNAMEMFARDAKSLGVFVARSLSPKGLTYRRLNYKLSKTERDMYNEVAQAWRTVDDAVTRGFQAVGGDPKSGKNDKGFNAKFRSRQLQCFNFLLTAFKTNALIDDAKKQLDDGKSVVIQVDSTYDAFIDRILKGKQKGDDLRDVIISPVEDLIGLVMDYFPIYKMRQISVERPNGDNYITNEIVIDEETGKAVVSQAALNIRNTLIAHLKRVRFNMSPLDRIINSLGGLANVAEVTRRKHRLIEQADGKIIDAKQPPSANKEVDAFNNGEKRVIIFSRAGNTGRSFHADKSFKNSQRRIHYLLEGGFSAFNAIQGFGRTHRSNESSQPEYVVLAADIPGEIRFISAIVRKLGQMGALTAGDRKNNTQGLYSEKDNMESRLAAIAINHVMGNLLSGAYPEFPNGDEVIRQMGFEPGTFGKKKIELKTIFNRILSLDLEIQDVLISYFNMEHEQLLLMAIQNGTADIGTENIRALDCETIQDKTILEDKAKGIKTKYLELKVKVKSRIRPFQNVSRVQHCEEFFIDQDGTIYAAKKNGQYETDEEGNQHFRPSFDMKNGEPIQRYTLFTTDMNTTYATDALALQNKKQNQKRIFTPVSRERAEELWQSQSSSIKKSHFETIHMISGVLLPIWNQLKQLKSSRVKRVILPDGTSIIGRTLEESEVKNVLRSFRVDYEGKTYTVQDVLRELEKPKTFARLSNNWKLKYSRVSGEKRIEILYNDYHDIPRLQKLGALVEIIGSDERAFVPVGNNDVLHSVITFNNVTGFENDSSADDILDEATQKINSNIPDSAKLYFIHPSFWGFGATPAEASDNPLIHTSNYPMDSDEREYRYQKSKEADSSKSAWQQLKEFGSKVWKGRHDIPELANEKGRIDDSLIKAQEWLRGLKRERQANVHEAEKRLKAALLGLSPDDFDLFQRAMELRDLYETRKSDPNASMPWGLNPKTLYDFDATDPVYDNYETIMGHVRKNPRVQEAMNKADTLIEDLRNKLIEAAERLGMFDVRDRLRRKHYFRHLVLEYYNMQRSGKPHPTFKNPERRGYMKHREGSSKDISSNWLLAMGEVFTRMTDDIKILDTLFKLRNEYDIIEKLKQEAFQTNMNNALSEIMKGLKDVPDELRKSKAEEHLQAVLQTRQARAISRLFKLAQNGDLPIGNNNEWQSLAGRMADAGQLEKLSREEQQKLSRYIGWLSALDDKTKARSAARSFLSGSRSKNAVLKKITGDKFVDWKDLIPDDYTLWSPSDSRLVFSASTTPEYMLKIAMDNIDELLGVPLSDLGKAIATGGNKQLWCIPERLADALDNIGKSQPMGAFGQIMTKLMSAFKRWVTIGPANGRLFKYNWRNFFGDIEAVLQGNPGALYYFNQAAKELTDVMLKGGIATGMLEEFQKRGGGLTTEAMTELERPDRIKEFSHLFEQKKTSNPLKWGVKALREYLYIATTLTNFRESILRYAAFLSYIQLIKDNNGVPPFYGMSKPREVKVVGDDIYDIAFKLANENLGAYDQISSNLQWLRDNNFVSFLSWVEVNTKRYARLMANIWQGNSYLEWWLKRKGQKFIDDLIGSGGGGDKEPPNNGGGSGGGGNNEPPKGNNGGDFADDDGDNEFRKLFRRLAKKSAVGALRLAITLALAAPLWGLLSIWNWLNSEDDEKLPPNVRNKPHLTIGTNAFTGEVMYMGDVGSAFDVLQMFGVGNIITGDLRDLLDGRTTFGEVAANIIDGPVSKLVSNANPFAKAVVEGFFGKRTFPSALHPTPIRDKGRFVAQSFGLEWYYDFLTDKPHKPFYDFSSSVVNTSNQDSSAYFYMISRRKQFEENVLGKYSDFMSSSIRNEAMRNAKDAADLGDRKAVRKYLHEFFVAGGSRQGLKISARTMEPLYGLNDTDKLRFVRWLPKEERKILRRAMRYAERLKARLGVW